MQSIATLTVNPTIDVAYDVGAIAPLVKTRTQGESYDPGGGGLNVARVFIRLGGNARCVYLSGGSTGPALDGLLDLHCLPRLRVPIAGPTRIATTVHDHATGEEYRFVPPGPEIGEDEWRACLDALATIECEMLVASGSLAPGMPDDFYARVTEVMAARGIGVALDTSGKALAEAVAAGGLLLVKPNLKEFKELTGVSENEPQVICKAAEALVKDGKAQIVAVTLGQDGAVLACAGMTKFLPGHDIVAQSAVGAGDSFVAAMVHALARGCAVEEAFRWGMAGGSAAVLTPGTSLAYPEEIERLFEEG
ncbi:MAG: 1-phosphofructokinase family hexose kinase [Sphingomonadaceae bacterium]